MFIARSSYEVAIRAYFEQRGLENSEVAHLAHHIAGETLHFLSSAPVLSYIVVKNRYY